MAWSQLMQRDHAANWPPSGSRIVTVTPSQARQRPQPVSCLAPATTTTHCPPPARGALQPTHTCAGDQALRAVDLRAHDPHAPAAERAVRPRSCNARRTHLVLTAVPS